MLSLELIQFENSSLHLSNFKNTMLSLEQDRKLKDIYHLDISKTPC